MDGVYEHLLGSFLYFCKCLKFYIIKKKNNLSHGHLFLTILKKVYHRQKPRSYCIAPGTVFNILWWITMENNMKKNVCVCIYIYIYIFCCLVTQLCPTLWPHEQQHARLSCPSSSPRICSNSCPLNRWCHPTTSSSVTPSPLALNLSQHQDLFQWVSSLHQVAKVLELQLQHQSF